MILRKTSFWKTVLLSVMVAALMGGFVVAAGFGASASKAPTQFTISENAKYKASPLDYSDVRDTEWVKRGFIARVAKGDPEPLRIVSDNGAVVWDMNRYAYIDGDISKPELFPNTVNPSLWRQAILNANYGLYEVVSRDFAGEFRGIYQVRGYDVANMSFVETRNGFIVVDVMSYKESAAAAVDLLYDHLPEEKKNKKIHTVIYTHSHADHYGGVLGVLEHPQAADKVEIVAPDGFMEATVSENVTAGDAMLGRARWMYGILLWHPELNLPEGHGQVNNGLAIGSGTGTGGLMPPTLVITRDGSRSFDGTSVEFLLAPNTEAPAEMTMLFPDYRSICLAEICNQTQHNILTPRGAVVRDTIAWSDALDAMKRQWVDSGRADSAWGPHTWPIWGKGAVAEYIGKQSHLYRYLHDQTVFLMNKGYDMKEIAEVFTFPPDLAKEWFNRGYYGATIHNVKAVYQKYLGWFDNNPASLWRLPDKTSAALYARYLPRSGGNLVEAAKAAYADGQYRWVVEVLDHVRLAPDAWGASVYAAAMELQADAFEQMGYAAESGIWRNYFLTGAWRNRSNTLRSILEMPVTASMGPDTVRNMETQQILDTLSTQINGFTSASSFKGTALWNVDGELFEMRMEDHVLWTRAISASSGTAPNVTITMTRDDLNLALLQVSAQTSWLDALLLNDNVKVDGNAALLSNIASLTHIAPPRLPSPGGSTPAPGPSPTPVPQDNPKLVLRWEKGGAFDGVVSEDSVIASVTPDGWLISKLRIGQIGDVVYEGDDESLRWNGLTFDIVSNDLSLAVRNIDVTGALEEEGRFVMSIGANVQKGTRTETIVGEITAGERRGSSSGGCDAMAANAGILWAGALMLLAVLWAGGLWGTRRRT